MPKHRAHSCQGFTLIEIAIVFILVGLLIGGVFKGMGMIRSAKISSLAKSADEMRVAVMTFQDRFQALPGDCNRADIPPNRAAGVMGDGNGRIEISTNEHRFAISDLRTAELLPLGQSDFPRHAFDGDYYINYDATQARHVVTFLNIPGDAAAELDAKYDDGVYSTGRIRADAAYTSQSVTVTWAY